MKLKRAKIAWFTVVVVMPIFILAGCAPEAPPEPIRICPGKATVQQALAELESFATKLKSFIAYGSGEVSFYEEGKDKPSNERIPTVKIWFEPPNNVRFWGDVAFNSRGLHVGSKSDEFWFAAKPKEIGNVYIWGRWDEQTKGGNIILNPKILRQAFGVIDAAEAGRWSLSNEGRWDILTVRDKSGSLEKKIYVECCNYRISRIEYYDTGERLIAALELNNHEKVDDMVIPHGITIISPNEYGSVDTFDIILKSVKPSDNIKAAVFERPSAKGYGEVYRMVNGRAVQLSDEK